MFAVPRPHHHARAVRNPTPAAVTNHSPSGEASYSGAAPNAATAAAAVPAAPYRPWPAATSEGGEDRATAAWPDGVVTESQTQWKSASPAAAATEPTTPYMAMRGTEHA